MDCNHNFSISSSLGCFMINFLISLNLFYLQKEITKSNLTHNRNKSVGYQTETFENQSAFSFFSLLLEFFKKSFAGRLRYKIRPRKYKKIKLCVSCYSEKNPQSSAFTVQIDFEKYTYLFIYKGEKMRQRKGSNVQERGDLQGPGRAHDPRLSHHRAPLTEVATIV